jgi:hypothetical protein
MNRSILALILVLGLSACGKSLPKPEIISAKPVQVPELTVSLAKKADRLPDITDPSLGGIIKDGIDTDIKYNALAFRYNRLVDFYNCVKIAVNIKDLDKCLQ